jgi:hypothetical protein
MNWSAVEEGGEAYIYLHRGEEGVEEDAYIYLHGREEGGEAYICHHQGIYFCENTLWKFGNS